MSKLSAGILLYRYKNGMPQFFLVHPGGPFWRKKDKHAWSIPKGEVTEKEDLLMAAKREFKEETGFDLPNGKLISLTPIKQKGGKIVYAWALEGDIDADAIKSNTFELEWPPQSGQIKTFEEIDKGAWFSLNDAENKIITAQKSLIIELLQKLNRKL